MRWKYQIYNPGEYREIKRFAIFPKKLDDGYWVWFEKYYQKQLCKRDYWSNKETWCKITHQKKLLDKLK